MSEPLARSTSWRSRRHRHWTNESVEKLGDVAGHPGALLATCPRRRHPARGVERVGAERGQRLVVGEHTERRTTKRVDLRGAAAADGADRPAGTSTTATSQSPASARLMVLPTPPSM